MEPEEGSPRTSGFSQSGQKPFTCGTKGFSKQMGLQLSWITGHPAGTRELPCGAGRKTTYGNHKVSINFKLTVVVSGRYATNGILSPVIWCIRPWRSSSKKSTTKTTDLSHKNCPHWVWKWTPVCSLNPWGLPCLAPAHGWVKIQFGKCTTPLGNNKGNSKLKWWASL